MTDLERAILHIKTRADAWAVKEVTKALQSISERLDKALSQEPKSRVKNELEVELNELEPCDDAISREYVLALLEDKKRTRKEITNRIYEVPSVTQKSGKWIYSDLLRVKHGTMNIDALIDKVWAKMESEDKE